MEMRFKVFDVGHGFCAEATASNNNLLLFDCGYSDTWRPSEYFRRPVSLLTIGNYDEDHVGDLPNVRQKLGINYLQKNSSLSGEQLRDLKYELNGEVSDAMENVADMMGSYTGTSNYQPDVLHPGIRLRWFWNQYNVDFDDTNNLSVVSFVDLGGNRFIVPGDMEKPGWERLLRREDFKKELAGVTVFITSHHGRESGYCPDVFDVARNVSVIVMSDCEKTYETQEMCNTYAQHARGVTFNGENRKVLTTRSDGTFWWTYDAAA